MSIIFSLLQYYPEPDSRPLACLPDLLIDEVIKAISPNEQASGYVISIIEHPLQNKDNIVYRQEILLDFQNNQGLLQELYPIFNRYQKLEAEWSKSLSRMQSQSNVGLINEESLDMIRDIINRLQINAQFCLKITAIPQVILNILNKYSLKSSGLIRIKEYCEAQLADKNILKLRQIARELANSAYASASYELVVELSETLNIFSSHLSRIHQDTNDFSSSSLISTIFKRNQAKDEEQDLTSYIVTRKSAPEQVALIAEALREVSNLISQIAKKIYPVFAKLGTELLFYNFAFRLSQIAAAEQVDLCMPVIEPEAKDVFKCNQLRDLYLVAKNYFAKRPLPQIISNELDLNSETLGVLIKGDNNSGKTTFLRSIGSAQIFGQAGLPILAHSGMISLRRNIVTQFSKQEEELLVNDVSGRFESEVKEVAAIINQLQPYSLILLNETFQTTAFEEAAVALFDILDIISDSKIKWILVTHISQLYENFYSDHKPILYLQTATEKDKRYKLLQV